MPAVAGTVAEALKSAAEALATAGVQTPRLDAEVLLAEAAGRDRAQLLAAPEAELASPAGRRFGAMVRRRLMREPVAQIVGRKGFRRIELEVDPRVLTPRPETELLVEVALELEPRTVLDIGTGSGAVALAVADELSDARVVAIDTSLDALLVATSNRERLGLADRVSLQHGRLPAEREFDLLLANLPYVSDGEWRSLEPEITRYEPYEAVVAGPTGLEAIDALLGELATGAIRVAALALEVGEGQAVTVAELARRAAFERVETRSDLAGIERAVVGTR